MTQTHPLKAAIAGIMVVTVLLLAAPNRAAAHCDTIDGPVIQDARKAIAANDITPILKWVKENDEASVRAAFSKLLGDRPKNREAAEHEFFSLLVKIHRAGEGEPFTGLKPAGAVEPAVAEADKALAGGSSDALVKLITGDIAAGIKQRYERAAAAYKHKDESVAQGRAFVEAYVAFTHYVEQVHQLAISTVTHGEHGGHDMHKTEQQHHGH